MVPSRAYLVKRRGEGWPGPWWRFSLVTEALEMELDNKLKDSERECCEVTETFD